MPCISENPAEPENADPTDNIMHVMSHPEATSTYSNTWTHPITRAFISIIIISWSSSTDKRKYPSQVPKVILQRPHKYILGTYLLQSLYVN